MGYPTQVHQVIMNLCSNAAHAMGAYGGVLTVELRDVRHDEETPERSDSNIVFK
jgi:signal transduction histidine kinase